MARNIDEIYQAIITEKTLHPELEALNSTSKVAIYNAWAYIVAVVIWTLENLFDIHKNEVNDLITTKKPHSLRWYRARALEFQYGQDINIETGLYDNTGLEEAEIAARKIVKQAAVTAADTGTGIKIRIKLATEINGELTPLTGSQLSAFNSGYINEIKDAGDRVEGESLPADALKLDLDIWYNPLVLRADGVRIDGEDLAPVKKAINNYLRNLKFNGEYANTNLLAALKNVDGVIYPNIKTYQAKYGLFPFTNIDEKYIPDSGYLRVADNDLTITYREYV